MTNVLLKTFGSDIIPYVQKILLFDHAIDHIEIEQHHGIIGLPIFREAMGSAVSTTTTRVFKSTTRKGSIIYLDEDTANIHNQPLRVAVKVIGNNTGIITTAYFASSKSHGVEIWRKA